MPIDVTTLPSTFVDEHGNVYGVYGSPQEYAESNDTNPGAIPDANMDLSVWTGKNPGDISVIGIPSTAPGARAPGARITVIKDPHPTFDRYSPESYERAFNETVGDRAPGAVITFSFWMVVVLVIALVAVWATYSLLMHIVNKDTEVTQTPITNPDGSDSGWVLICKGGTCQYFNTQTGESKNGPSNESMLSELLKPVVILAAVGIGTYAAIKIIGALGSSSKGKAAGGH
jgi:hypothetical protein